MKSKKTSGFTLVEIMVAILLLIVVILGSSMVLYQVGGTIQVQGHHRIAGNLVNDLLESSTSMDYQDLTAIPDSTTNVTLNGLEFTIQRTVVPVTSPLMPFIERWALISQITYKDLTIRAQTLIIPNTGIVEEGG